MKANYLVTHRGGVYSLKLESIKSDTQVRYYLYRIDGGVKMEGSLTLPVDLQALAELGMGPDSQAAAVIMKMTEDLI